MRPFTPPLSLLSRLSLGLLALSGCATLEAATPGAAEPSAAASAAAAPATEASADSVAIPNAARPLPGVTTGGQPSDDDLDAAAAAGYRTVISLRADGEPGSEGEQAKVEALGMTFVSIPVAGAADLTIDNAQKLADALDADGARPAILHCGSGNRAGALLAIKAFHVDGKSAEEALELGKRAGLTKLEPAVTERLTR